MAGNQIIDRRTVAIPGPTGRAAKITGTSATSVPADQPAAVSMSGPDTDRQFAFQIPRGLPGVNAVPADEAVAAYLSAPDSHAGEIFSTKADKRLFDARDYGIVPDGDTDNTALIQTMVNLSEYGIVFPQGTYLISSPIEVPYKTHPYTVHCVGHVVFKAIEEMPYMFRLGGETDGTKDLSEFWRWCGGLLDGNLKASEGLRFTGNLTGFDVHHVGLNRIIDRAIHMEVPTRTTSHDAKFVDIRINAVRNSSAPTLVGIQADGGDWQMSDVYATDCMTFVKSAGLVQATNTHWFNAAAITGDAVFNVTSGGVVADNLYIDTIETGITPRKADGAYANIRVVLSNVFVFQYAAKPGDTNIVVKVRDAPLLLTNVFGSFASTDGGTCRVLRIVTPDGNPAFSGDMLKVENVTLRGDRDDAIRLGLYGRTQRVTNQNTSHSSGQGVLIALIPQAVSASEVRSQVVKFFALLGADTSQGDVPIYANNTGGFFRSIALGGKFFVTGSGTLAKQKTPLPGRAALYFGVREPIDINGVQFVPLYLYSADASIGYVPEMWGEISPGSNPFLWMDSEPWEPGLTDASFLWTSKSIV